MKAGLFIFPFLALLIAAIGTALGSTVPQVPWLSAVSWATAAALVALWVVLDFENFKVMFRRKGTKYGASSGLVVLLGIVVIIGVAVVSSRPRFNKSYDATSGGINTLSDMSKKIMLNTKGAAAGEQISVIGFFSDEGSQSKFNDLINLYQAAGGDFKIEYVDPERDPTRAIAEKVTSGNTVIFRSGKQEKRITTFNEERVTNALINILKESSKKIYFTSGHGEGDLHGTEETGFSAVAQELESNKNQVATLSLLEAAKVPDDANMLIIAGPKYDFKEEETRIVEDYLKRGGSVLAMVDAMIPVENLNKTLEKFGVKFNDDLIILAPDDARAQIMGQNNALISDFDAFNPVTKDFAKQSSVALLLKNTRSVGSVDDNQNQLKVTLAGKTHKDMIKVKDVRSPKDLEGGLTKDRWQLGSEPVIAVSVGKAQAPATAGNDKAADDATNKADVTAKPDATQGKETRLVAVGSVEFAVNGGATVPENRDMFMNMTSYLLQDEDFISIRPKDPLKTTLTLTSVTSQIVLLLICYLFPFLFLGGGVWVWLKRRNA